MTVNQLLTFDLYYWSPEGRKIATVQARDTRVAIRKAPMPYRKALGEIYAIEIAADERIYHPHRTDGLDANLTRLNEADFLMGMRCTCSNCLSRYENSREYKRRLESWK